ncbi:MAG: hypothetical protein K2X41_00405 [Hyphomicrobium sp.]|nr:hypothetical protein [Hyphomicrobium sp.]
MRRALIALLPLLAGGPAFAADCSKDVAAAFEKQRTSKAFRVAMTQPSAEGPVDMTVDYLPPDRMLQTVKAAHMPGEQQTMLVGSRAFAGSSGAFEELLPQFTQSIVAEVATAVGPPQNLGAFECLGTVGFEGKDYVAYRTADPAAAGADPAKTMARTIYVDPASGLPAYNVVAALAGKDEPVLKAVYSYPADLTIEAPVGAPVQKAHQ